MKTGYLVADIMTTRPVNASPVISVKECASMMKKNNIGSLLLMNNGKLAGIVTERDIVTKVVSQNLDASKTKVSEIMTPMKDIISIEPHKDIYEAMVLMKDNDVRRLPVMDKAGLKGYITFKDIVRIEPALFELIIGNLDLRESERKMKVLEDE